MGLLDLIDWGFFDIIIGPIISFIIKIIITLVLLGIGFFGAMRLPRPTAKMGGILIIIILIALVWIFL